MMPTTDKIGEKRHALAGPLHDRVAACRVAAGRIRPGWRGLGGVVDRSVQGPYPVGNPSAQPDQKFAFPDPATGARDQTFRLIVRPDLWGRQARIRLSNAFGTKPVTFDGVHVGLQSSSAALLRGLQPSGDVRRKAFRHRPPGGSAWSDAVALPFVKTARRTRRPPARGQLPYRRRQRPDDLARQGAAPPPTSPRPAPAPRVRWRTRRHFPTPRRPGSSSMRLR